MSEDEDYIKARLFEATDHIDHLIDESVSRSLNLSLDTLKKVNNLLTKKYPQKATNNLEKLILERENKKNSASKGKSFVIGEAASSPKPRQPRDKAVDALIMLACKQRKSSRKITRQDIHDVTLIYNANRNKGTIDSKLSRLNAAQNRLGDAQGQFIVRHSTNDNELSNDGEKAFANLWSELHETDKNRVANAANKHFGKAYSVTPDAIVNSVEGKKK